MTFDDWWRDYIGDPGRHDLQWNVQAETAALDAWEAAIDLDRRRFNDGAGYAGLCGGGGHRAGRGGVPERHDATAPAAADLLQRHRPGADWWVGKKDES